MGATFSPANDDCACPPSPPNLRLGTHLSFVVVAPPLHSFANRWMYMWACRVAARRSLIGQPIAEELLPPEKMVVPPSGQSIDFRMELKTLLNSIMANYGQFMEMLVR